MLTEDLQLQFATEVLQVSSTCQDRGDVVGLIVDTFKTAWLDSRWVTLGPASQVVVVLCIRSNVGAFPYHLGGFARFLVRDKRVHGAGRHCVQGVRQRFVIIAERSARPSPVRRNLEV